MRSRGKPYTGPEGGGELHGIELAEHFEVTQLLGGRDEGAADIWVAKEAKVDCAGPAHAIVLLVIPQRRVRRRLGDRDDHRRRLPVLHLCVCVCECGCVCVPACKCVLLSVCTRKSLVKGACIAQPPCVLFSRGWQCARPRPRQLPVQLAATGLACRSRRSLVLDGGGRGGGVGGRNDYAGPKRSYYTHQGNRVLLRELAAQLPSDLCHELPEDARVRPREVDVLENALGRAKLLGQTERRERPGVDCVHVDHDHLSGLHVPDVLGLTQVECARLRGDAIAVHSTGATLGQFSDAQRPEAVRVADRHQAVVCEDDTGEGSLRLSHGVEDLV